jgi:hypothetical protein
LPNAGGSKTNAFGSAGFDLTFGREYKPEIRESRGGLAARKTTGGAFQAKAVLGRAPWRQK